MNKSFKKILTFAILSSAIFAEDISKPQDSEILQQLALSKGLRKGVTLHIGCGDGELTREIHKMREGILQGLDFNFNRIEKTRKNLKDIYGKLSIEFCDMKQLPYRTNTANLIVIDSFDKMIKQGLSIKEIIRVLNPYGTFIGKGDINKADLTKLGIVDIKTTNNITIFTKPWSKDMDSWAQDKRDVSRTRVSNDKLLPPSGIQWINGDKWKRSEGVDSYYSTNGRFFFVKRKGKYENFIIACDAFNGFQLWRKQIPASAITMHEDNIFLMSAKNIEVLDAISGNTVKTFKISTGYNQYGSSSSGAITYHKGLLIVKSGLEAYDAETGKLVWKSNSNDFKRDENGFGTRALMSRSVACAIENDLLFTRIGNEKKASSIICLNINTGKTIWTIPNDNSVQIICCKNGVLYTKKRTKKSSFVIAYSMKNGAELWSHNTNWNGREKPYCFPIGNSVWVSLKGEKKLGAQPSQYALELDAKTGEEKRRIEGRMISGCPSYNATKDYFIGRHLSFMNKKTGNVAQFKAGRATCRNEGILPANGLIYQDGHKCICYSSLRGTAAFSTIPFEELEKANKEKLYKGKAYGAKLDKKLNSPENWQTYRKNSFRGSFTKSSIPENPKLAWKTSIGGKISQPIIAGNNIFVSNFDKYSVHAFSIKTGEQIWEYSTGGPIDSAPTFWKGLILFGSRDGFVYCLKANDGTLVWRFHGAPSEYRIAVNGHLESPWKIPGSVIIDEDIAYFAAGRHTDTDTGIFVYALKVDTGEALWQNNINANNIIKDRIGVLKGVKDKNQKFYFPMGSSKRNHKTLVHHQNIIMVSNEKTLFLDNLELDKKTGKISEVITRKAMFAGAFGFLMDNTTPPFSSKNSRKNWRYRGYRANLLATDGKRMVGNIMGGGKGHHHGSEAYYRGTHFLMELIFNGNKLFGVRDTEADAEIVFRKKGWWPFLEQHETQSIHWSVETPKNLVIKSIVLANDKIVTVSINHPNYSFIETKHGSKFKYLETPSQKNQPTGKDAELTIYEFDGGKEIAKIPLGAIPAFDGLSIAQGKIFVTTADGHILCFGK